ncbi:hypothetical protein ElyMa_005458000 [Elysia marginata]|uniref:Uncharacterized protein n=1 Tax=Elysia marginata TaxID=1093978 RepID=A0AAV4EQ10_9GAST|nr:hypothetical protein ElyMa_005458000 [Elysia marginata]
MCLFNKFSTPFYWSLCATCPPRRTKPIGEEIQDGYLKLDPPMARHPIICSHNTPHMGAITLYVTAVLIKDSIEDVPVAGVSPACFANLGAAFGKRFT